MTPRAAWPDGVHAVQCNLRLEGNTEPTHWDPDLGPLPVHRLVSFRAPMSHDRSRHVPVRAFSRCTGTTVWLESGLEYELFRVVDRAPQTARIVTQPFQLRWRQGTARRSHVPDLLVVQRDGSVQLWDARPLQRRDTRFDQAVAVIRVFAAMTGWAYETFAGQDTQTRLNLMWLYGYRRQRPWHQARTTEIVDFLIDRGGQARLGDLWGVDDGTGEVVSTVWYLLYRGLLRVDESKPLSAASRTILAQEEPQ